MPGLKHPATELGEAALAPHVCRSLKRLADPPLKAVLIGTLAMNFHRRVRYRLSFTLMFASEGDIAFLSEFVRHSPLHWSDGATGVEILTFTPETAGIPVDVVGRVLDTADQCDGMRVASAEGLAVVKLYASLTPRQKSAELADVQNLLERYPAMDLDDWHLPAELQRRFEECRVCAQAPAAFMPPESDLWAPSEG